MLSRRRSDNPRQVAWHVFYGDVRVGSIGERAGAPVDVDRWQWSCGFYPGLHPGQHRNGTAASFEEARVGFEADWKALLPGIPQGAFDEWRHQRDFTKEKYASWDRGERMPSQKPSSMMRCPCGEMFDSHRLEQTTLHVPHITATVGLVARARPSSSFQPVVADDLQLPS